MTLPESPAAAAAAASAPPTESQSPMSPTVTTAAGSSADGVVVTTPSKERRMVVSSQPMPAAEEEGRQDHEQQHSQVARSQQDVNVLALPTVAFHNVQLVQPKKFSAALTPVTPGKDFLQFATAASLTKLVLVRVPLERANEELKGQTVLASSLLAWRARSMWLHAKMKQAPLGWHASCDVNDHVGDHVNLDELVIADDEGAEKQPQRFELWWEYSRRVMVLPSSVEPNEPKSQKVHRNVGRLMELFGFHLAYILTCARTMKLLGSKDTAGVLDILVEQGQLSEAEAKRKVRLFCGLCLLDVISRPEGTA